MLVLQVFTSCFFVSMEGGKFERQVASSKAYIQKQKDAFVSESVKLPLGSSLGPPTPCYDDDGFCLAAIYHSMLWIHAQWF